MKKSAQVPATMIMALAASLTSSGCSSYQDQCVDAYGNYLPNSACQGGGGYGGGYGRVYGGAHYIRVRSGGFGGSSGGGGSFGS